MVKFPSHRLVNASFVLVGGSVVLLMLLRKCRFLLVSRRETFLDIIIGDRHINTFVFVLEYVVKSCSQKHWIENVMFIPFIRRELNFRG
jgi:hypothetical protein